MIDWDNPLVFGESPPLPEDINIFKASLHNRNSVHLMMLSGKIAKPSIEQLMHIYADVFSPLLELSRENGIEDADCISWAIDYIKWHEGNNLE